MALAQYTNCKTGSCIWWSPTIRKQPKNARGSCTARHDPGSARSIAAGALQKEQHLTLDLQDVPAQTIIHQAQSQVGYTDSRRECCAAVRQCAVCHAGPCAGACVTIQLAGWRPRTGMWTERREAAACGWSRPCGCLPQ
eukprot:COSAG03_NODE_887_length_5485_cov_57.389157_2_plen_139_part_00